MYSKSDPQVSFFQHLKNNNITSANIKSKFSDAKKKIIFLQRAHYYFAINSIRHMGYFFKEFHYILIAIFPIFLGRDEIYQEI